ncbi:hypothetical protein Lfu02_79940 [Longispora fulva]|uniref:Phage portal protein n=1 Tax=Longispora fulva TaxID=619741 RepID=A0A8J7GI78_9ACTN|nr:phage portal protein [Longispora fulva]MBG6141123.1 hypothetical protein [Longispora fulva]GIG63622.1 hypothetical protein Lfu02_79940 [Longispora fulva]
MPLAPEHQLARLVAEHQRDLRQLREFADYYDNDPPYAYMVPELIAELGDRLQQLLINWPRLVVDTAEERADVLGFRVAGVPKADGDLWDIWQANNLDEASSQAHTDAMVMGRAFMIISANPEPDRPPLITAESPLETHAILDPATRRVTSAYKAWTTDGDGDGPPVEHATLYLPNETRWYVKTSGGEWVDDPEFEADEHQLGRVPVVPIVNRPRLRRPLGQSELVDVIPLVNGANKIGTDMMTSAEFHSMPRRWALGFGPEDFQDAQGRPVSTWSKIAGRIWASTRTRSEGAEVGQFPEADLANFHSTLRALATLVASLYGLPPTYMGLSFDNPPSADGVRSLEARLIKRVERKSRPWSGSHEDTMRFADRFVTGVWRPELVRLETIWRDPATPTRAQASDAAVKLYTSGISTKRQAREDVGYTVEQIDRMEADDAAALASDPIGQMTRALSAGQEGASAPGSAGSGSTGSAGGTE